MQFARSDHDLYRTLGVEPSASMEQIRLAYRQRAMMWHPDRNGRPDAGEKFKLIRFAYDILRDPSRRAEYDRRAASSAEGSSSAPPRADQHERRAASAPDVRRRVHITLQEQLRGGSVELQVSRTADCATCAGSGVSRKTASCDVCGGDGYMRPSLGWFPSFFTTRVVCRECQGKGVTQPKCIACDGRGTIARRGHLRFDIPAGIPPGGILRIPGQGRRGRGEKRSGDLILNVGVASHPLFEPEFPHLRCDMPISIFRALAGGMIEVPTLDTTVSVPLPSESVDGTQLRVTGHGMLNGATGERGDLLLKLRLIRPRTLSVAQRELLAKLERLAADDPRHVDWARRQRDAENMKRSSHREAA